MLNTENYIYSLAFVVSWKHSFLDVSWKIFHMVVWNLNCHCDPTLNVTTVPAQFIKHHDDVIKWKHFPSYWPFVRGIHRSPMNSSHTGQWRGALMICLICAWINAWVNNSDAGDLRRHGAHYDVTVMICERMKSTQIGGMVPHSLKRFHGRNSRTR